MSPSSQESAQGRRQERSQAHRRLQIPASLSAHDRGACRRIFADVIFPHAAVAAHDAGDDVHDRGRSRRAGRRQPSRRRDRPMARGRGVPQRRGTARHRSGAHGRAQAGGGGKISGFWKRSPRHSKEISSPSPLRSGTRRPNLKRSPAACRRCWMNRIAMSARPRRRWRAPRPARPASLPRPRNSRPRSPISAVRSTVKDIDQVAVLITAIQSGINGSFDQRSDKYQRARVNSRRFALAWAADGELKPGAMFGLLDA